MPDSLYVPCSRCGAKWNMGRKRFFHKPGCDLTKVALEQLNKPLPESLHVLIERYAMAYHEHMVLWEKGINDKALGIASEALAHSRRALNAAISAHRLG